MLFLSPFYMWENWCTERLTDLLRVTQPAAAKREWELRLPGSGVLFLTTALHLLQEPSSDLPISPIPLVRHSYWHTLALAFITAIYQSWYIYTIVSQKTVLETPSSEWSSICVKNCRVQITPFLKTVQKMHSPARHPTPTNLKYSRAKLGNLHYRQPT